VFECWMGGYRLGCLLLCWCGEGCVVVRGLCLLLLVGVTHTVCIPVKGQVERSSAEWALLLDVGMGI
jgi:hypothetical protein